MIVSQVSSLPGVADGQAGRCRSPGKKGTVPIGAKPFFRPAPRTAPAATRLPFLAAMGWNVNPRSALAEPAALCSPRSATATRPFVA